MSKITTPDALGPVEFTAIIKQDGGWWVDWIEEVPGVKT